MGSALGIARAQQARGHRVELHGWRPEAGRRRYELDGVAVRVTPGWPWARTRRVDGRVIAPLLAMSAGSAAADIAHVHADPHLLLVPRARARVIHFQTPIPESPVGLYRRLVRRADLVVCCSRFVRERFLAQLEFPPERVAVVHNGVDLDRFARPGAPADRRPWGIAADELVVLYVGAVVPAKGLLHLVRAIGRVHGEHPCRLLVAGGAGLWPTPDAPRPGADAYTVSVQAAAKDLPVTWLGVLAQEQMPQIYALADVFACPSVWEEPFGTVNVEAMAAGTPVVASRAGGIPEVVADGETGLLVPPGDPDALARALATLIDDPHRRRQLGAAARLRAAAFTWEAAAKRLDALYREALRNEPN